MRAKLLKIRSISISESVHYFFEKIKGISTGI